MLNHPWEFGLVVAVGLGLALELGYRVGAHFQVQENPNRKEQLGTIRDGFFILVSLLVGFTLALAAARFAERRSLLIEDAVSIGTAYLRAGTLPQPYRDHSQALFRNYIDCRLALDNAGYDAVRLNQASNDSKRIQEELWNDAAAVARVDRSDVTALYLSALNETIDLHHKRIAAFQNRIPLSIWILITTVALIAVFTRGVTITSRFWLTVVLVPITIAIVVALVADLDAPSSGWIRLDHRAMERIKVDLSDNTTK